MFLEILDHRNKKKIRVKNLILINIYIKKKLKMSSQFRKLTPLLNRVLVQKYEPIKKTASGILL